MVLLDTAQTTRIAETATAVSCTLLRRGRSVPATAEAGRRPTSLGRGLSGAADGAVATGAPHVLDHGAPDPGLPRLRPSVAAASGRS
jgi:hypothetical protein